MLGSRTPRPGVAEISVARPAFAGLAEENDPRFAREAFAPPVPAGDVFSMPRSNGPARRITGLPEFVTVRGGAYFFLPGCARCATSRAPPSTAPILAPPPVAPHPGPLAAGVRALHRGLESGLHAERRLEPFFRPAFNRAFREPLAGLLQYLINRRRPDEGLGSPRSASLPTRRRASSRSSTVSAGYIRRTYRPGTAERGGNTKTHGIVRAEVRIRDDLPEHMRRGIFAQPRSFARTCASPGPARTCRTTSTTWASSAWP